MPTLLGIFIIIILFVIWKFIREMIKENRDSIIKNIAKESVLKLWQCLSLLFR